MSMIETSLVLSIVSIIGMLGNGCLTMCMKKECYSKCCIIKNDTEEERGPHTSVEEIVEAVIDRSARSHNSIEELKKIVGPSEFKPPRHGRRRSHSLNVG